MRIWIYILISVFCFSFVKKEEKHVYCDNLINSTYTKKNGTLNGVYTSYYKNGKKRSEGNFTYNKRVGEWKVWDSIGNLVIKNCSPILETINSVGFYDYHELKEKNIVWEKMIWKNLNEFNSNANLFKDNNFFNLLKTNINQNKIVLFVNEEFNKSKKENSVDLDNYRLILLKTREDVYYDSSRNIMEHRLIAICPIVSKGSDTLEVGWIFYPSIRHILAKVPLKIDKAGFIRNFEDLFFFNSYGGEIEKELNVYNRTLKSYCKSPETLKKERERIEVNLIETEHDFWLKN